MTIQIGNRTVGPGHPVWIVAEIGPNHSGSLRRAKRLVRAAAEAGADAVKFQAFLPADLTVNSRHPAYRLREGAWKGRTLWGLYSEALTPPSWFPELFALARELGLEPFASAFSPAAVRDLESLGVRVHKLASAEVSHEKLVEKMAATGRPVILSDGMATTLQLATALDRIGQENTALLHCVSGYPAEPWEYRLQLIRELASKTGQVVGLSDHTRGTLTAVAAVALGASIVEKHLMLEHWKYWKAPLDAGHSLDPGEFAHLVGAIRLTEETMALPPVMGRSPETGGQWRRRLVFRRALAKGETVTASELDVKRCGEGLEPDQGAEVFGRKLAVGIRGGDPVTEGVLI